MNLTLDCANFEYDTGAVEESSNSVSSVRAGRPTPRPSQCRESSISSASGLGIEPAMQAIHVFSNMLRYAPSRDSIRSTGSCDERRNFLGTYLVEFSFLLNETMIQWRFSFQIALNLHLKSRPTFRFSSLKHPSKRRSKSQANISKVIKRV